MKDLVPEVRLCFHGTRTCLATPVTDLITYFEKKEPEAQGKTSTRKLINIFRAMTDTQIQDYIQNQGASLYMATISENEMMYLPPGYAISEAVGTSKHCFGLRIGFLLPGHLPLLTTAHEKLDGGP